jgi:hypothetical protein
VNVWNQGRAECPAWLLASPQSTDRAGAVGSCAFDPQEACMPAGELHDPSAAALAAGPRSAALCQASNALPVGSTERRAKILAASFGRPVAAAGVFAPGKPYRVICEL